LRDLVRIKSLARQESTLVTYLRTELGQEGGTEIVQQSLGPTSQNLIEVPRGHGTRCFVIDAHTDTVPEGRPDQPATSPTRRRSPRLVFKDCARRSMTRAS
jgi:acetylornithine deacetylase/succinyl-diaminopimelate desuccinylase-like protein